MNSLAKASVETLSNDLTGQTSRGPAPTITIVAKAAGVSVATVSRVLNGNSNVTPATYSKVMKIITQLGYHPNLHAQQLSLTKRSAIRKGYGADKD